MNSRIKKVILAAMLASLTCVVTMIIAIPTPFRGYINPGDALVLLTGWVLPSGYAFLAAGIGSAMADVFASYIVYAPATFIIKGLMALVTHVLFLLINRKTGRGTARIISGAVAEMLMILCYYLFEGILYGFIPAAANITANAVQAVAGLILGTILAALIEKNRNF